MIETKFRIGVTSGEEEGGVHREVQSYIKYFLSYTEHTGVCYIILNKCLMFSFKNRITKKYIL